MATGEKKRRPRGVKRGECGQDMKLEKHIWSSERRFRSLIQNLSDMIIILDDKGLVSYESPAWSKTLGYPEGHFVSQSPFPFIHPDDLEIVLKDLADALRHSIDGVPTAFRFRKSEGTWAFLEALGENLMDHPDIRGIVITVRDVTERRNVEEALREMEERYRLLLHATRDVIYTVSPDLTLLSISPSVETLVGYKPEEIIGRNILEINLVHPDHHDRAAADVRRLLSGQSVGPLKHKLLARDGSTKVVEIVGTPLIRGGEVIGFTVIARDITEKREAEKALRCSEEKYRSILNNMDSGYFEVDPRGNITFFNRALMEYLGYQEREMIGLNYGSFMDEKESRRVYSLFLEVYHTGQPRNFYWQLIRKDGTKTYAMASVHLMRDDRGNIAGFSGTSRDITELKQIEETLREREETLRESERRLANIIDFLPDATLVIDNQGQVIAWNRAIEEMTGMKSADIIGKGNYEHAIPFYDERRPILVDLALKADEGIEKYYTNIGREGDRIFGEALIPVKREEETIWWGMASPLRDSEGKIVGAIETIRDISHRKKAERELQSAKEMADAANRAKGEFLANMSHEIRTPLNAIVGMAELGMDLDLPEGARDIVHTIGREADHLVSLINQILDFSKIEAGRLELESIPFDLAYLMDHLAEAFAFQAERKELTFLSYLESDVPAQLVGDPGRLRQILANLIGNALKFTHEGEVCVTGKVAAEIDDRVTLRFSVRDTGIGISRDKLDRIFESFTQADGSTTRKYGGTGLGTTISKRLVELLGGCIGVESEEGRGSTFWFELTFPKQKDLPLGRKYEAAELQGIRVLVVDDHPINRKILREHLTSWGCRVTEAANGMDALSALEGAMMSADPAFALVLTDHQMPDMDGFSLAETVSRDDRWKDIPVILVTSIGRPGDGKRCRDLGIKGYLTKPIRKNDLYRAITKTLSGPSRRDEERVVTRHSIAEEKRKSIRILLVEDYPTSRQIALKHLTDAGYDVDTAENGRKALEAWKSTAYDLILMDVQMPVMDGYEATKIMREMEAALMSAGPAGVVTRGRVPIVATTAHAMQEFVDRCLEAGMDDVLTKPLKRQKLLDAVERWTLADRGMRRPVPVAAGRTGLLANPVYDHARAIEEFGGDRDFLVRVVSEFVEKVKSQQITLREACASGDAETLHREAHSIKGGAANLTAMELSEAARALERIGKSGNVAGADGAMDALVHAFCRFEATIGKSMEAGEGRALS